MSYLYYLFQACLVVLLMYTIPKIWTMSSMMSFSFTLPKLPQVPNITVPQSIDPFKNAIVFLIVAFVTITVVEKWLKYFFVSADNDAFKTLKKDEKQGSMAPEKLGTFGTMLL